MHIARSAAVAPPSLLNPRSRCARAAKCQAVVPLQRARRLDLVQCHQRHRASQSLRPARCCPRSHAVASRAAATTTTTTAVAAAVSRSRMRRHLLWRSRRRCAKCRRCSSTRLRLRTTRRSAAEAARAALRRARRRQPLARCRPSSRAQAACTAQGGARKVARVRCAMGTPSARAAACCVEAWQVGSEASERNGGSEPE